MAYLYWKGAAASGDWSLASNWSTGSVPVSGDSVVIDGRSLHAVDAGLDQSLVTLASLTIGRSNVQDVGTPDAALRIGATVVGVGPDAGSSGGGGATLVRLDLGTAATTITVDATGSAPGETSGLEPLVIRAANAANVLHVRGGTVGVATGSPTDAATFAAVNVLGGRARLAAGATVAAVNLSGGDLSTAATATAIEQSGGKLRTFGPNAVGSIAVGGESRLEGTGTVGRLDVYDGGLADFSGSSAARTVTACHKHGDAARVVARTASPLAVTFTAGVACERSGNANLDFGDHVRVTASAV